METRLRTQEKAAPPPSFTPVRGGVLQRARACGGSAGLAGECEECGKQRLSLQRSTQNSEPESRNSGGVPPIVHDVMRSPGQPLDAQTRAFMEPRFGHDFSRVRVHTNALGTEAGAGQWERSKLNSASLDNSCADGAVRTAAQNKTTDVNTNDAPTPSPAPKAGPECDDDKKAEKLYGSVSVVLIADKDGKNPTTAPSFLEAIEIWEKCCVVPLVLKTTTLCDEDFKTLDENSTSNDPTEEEKKLFKAQSGSGIQVFVPEMFAQGGQTGKNISGGGHVFEAGTSNPKIVIVEGAVPEVMAHELGHAFGYHGHHDSGTIMEGTGAYDKANLTAVSASVCKEARTGTALRKSGTPNDCCMSLK